MAARATSNDFVVTMENTKQEATGVWDYPYHSSPLRLVVIMGGEELAESGHGDPRLDHVGGLPSQTIWALCQSPSCRSGLSRSWSRGYWSLRTSSPLRPRSLRRVPSRKLSYERRKVLLGRGPVQAAAISVPS